MTTGQVGDRRIFYGSTLSREDQNQVQGWVDNAAEL
jgi:hypothetical protein